MGYVELRLGMLTGRRWLIVPSVAAAMIGGTVAVNSLSSAGAPVGPGDEVVAVVDGEPVYARHLGPHLRPEEPWVGLQPPADPVEVALDEAIAVRLVAAEASRLGLTPADSDGGRAAGSKPGGDDLTDARLYRALIDRELAADGGPDEVTTAQAREYFEQHRERMSRLHEATVSAIVVRDLATARGLLPLVADADDAEFRRLSRQHSIDAPSRARDGVVVRTESPVDDLPIEVARLVVSFREDGAFGLAEDDHGRYWVVRVSDVSVDSPRWSTEIEHRVRELMRIEQQERVTDELVGGLRSRAEVVVDHAALDRYRTLVAGEVRAATP